MPYQKAVAITGPRQLAPADVPRVRAVLRDLVAKPDLEAIFFGGAIGADTEALRAALECRERERPRLIVVVPWRVSDQPSEARTWIARADEVIELGNPITVSDGYDSYKARNRYMVDHATKVVAFWNGLEKSGTGHCVRYAEGRGVGVLRVPVLPP